MSKELSPIHKQKTTVGSPVVVDGVSFISLGQVMWPVGPTKICVADLLIDGKKMEKDVELRDIKACIRTVDTAPPTEAKVVKLNREQRRTPRPVAKKKKKH